VPDYPAERSLYALQELDDNSATNMKADEEGRIGFENVSQVRA
jgi:hypothetical protein